MSEGKQEARSFTEWWNHYSNSVEYHDEHYADHEDIAAAAWEAAFHSMEPLADQTQGKAQPERKRNEGMLSQDDPVKCGCDEWPECTHSLYWYQGFRAGGVAMAEKAAQVLRKLNDLQHRMAIELDAIPQQPRIEFYTRQMEQIICDALAGAVPATVEEAQRPDWWQQDTKGHWPNELDWEGVPKRAVEPPHASGAMGTCTQCGGTGQPPQGEAEKEGRT